MSLERSDSPAPANTNALIDRCYDIYRDEYLRIFPSGGDEQDHEEAIYSAVAAVVIEVIDALAVALAEVRWPERYVGDLTTAEWRQVYESLKHPERFLAAEEVAEYERCKQSVIDAKGRP